VGNPPVATSQEVQESGLYSTETIYSESGTPSLADAADEGYIAELAADLASTVGACNPNEETLRRIARMLPDLLRAFALKIGFKTENALDCQIVISPT
jgi:hypothetical protein